MKITIIKQQVVLPSQTQIPDQWFFPDSKEIQINCNGNGAKGDPIVIDNSVTLPKRFTIRNNRVHILIKNVKLKKLGLDGSENIKFESCEISQVRLRSSSNIKFNDIIISYDLRMKECDNIILKKSFIKKILSFKSEGCTFQECYIIQLRDWMSKNNIYEENEIRCLESNVKQSSFNNRNTQITNKFKKIKYKSKHLFLIGPKALLSDAMCWVAVIFIIFFALGLFEFLDYFRSNEILLNFFLYSPIIFTAMLFLYIYVYHLCYKIKLRVKSKR